MSILITVFLNISPNFYHPQGAFVKKKGEILGPWTWVGFPQWQWIFKTTAYVSWFLLPMRKGEEEIKQYIEMSVLIDWWDNKRKGS